MTPLERAMVVLHCYRCAICNHSAAICAQINRGWVTLGPNLGVFPLEQTRHVGIAKSEHPMLTNDEIIFEFHHNPPTSQRHKTDGPTDMRSQYRALH